MFSPLPHTLKCFRNILRKYADFDFFFVASYTFKHMCICV